ERGGVGGGGMVETLRHAPRTGSRAPGAARRRQAIDERARVARRGVERVVQLPKIRRERFGHVHDHQETRRQEISHVSRRSTKPVIRPAGSRVKILRRRGCPGTNSTSATSTFSGSSLRPPRWPRRGAPPPR